MSDKRTGKKKKQIKPAVQEETPTLNPQVAVPGLKKINTPPKKSRV